MNEWVIPVLEPLIVETTTQVSYLVSATSEFRVWDVTLPGTVTSAGGENR